MIRRRNPLTDRLAVLEAANRADRWHFTLDDGSTADLPVGAVLDAIREAMAGYEDPEAEHPPVSRTLRLLARVADGTETSVLGTTAVSLARHAVEQQAARSNGTPFVSNLDEVQAKYPMSFRGRPQAPQKSRSE